jgi:hypothetical protein
VKHFWRIFTPSLLRNVIFLSSSVLLCGLFFVRGGLRVGALMTFTLIIFYFNGLIDSIGLARKKAERQARSRLVSAQLKSLGVKEHENP